MSQNNGNSRPHTHMVQLENYRDIRTTSTPYSSNVNRNENNMIKLEGHKHEHSSDSECESQHCNHDHMIRLENNDHKHTSETLCGLHHLRNLQSEQNDHDAKHYETQRLHENKKYDDELENYDKYFAKNRNEYKKMCVESNLPDFVGDGFCFCCRNNVFKNWKPGDGLITGCVVCGKTFCD